MPEDEGGPDVPEMEPPPWQGSETKTVLPETTLADENL